MSISSRYRHQLAIHRNVQTVVGGIPQVDDYNQPVYTDTTVATVPGLIQPRRASETPNVEAGAAVLTDVAFLDPTDITSRDWLVVDGLRYDLVGPPRNAGGVDHHLELDLRQVL